MPVETNASVPTQTVDYCIVGSGAAGCVLANRLSEGGKHQVMLLEAGPSDAHPFIHIPAGFIFVYRNKRYNWGFQAEPDPNLNNRVLTITQGKVLGGSSSINGMLHVRAQKEDFAQWGADGCTGWSYEAMLPYYRKAETYHGKARSATALRGFEGLHGVSDASGIHPLSQAFVEAAQEVGMPFVEDMNGETREGASFFQHNRVGRFRSQPAQTYLRAARRRPNLQVKVEALATQVLFEGTRAVGVRYRQGGQVHQVMARKEVIVSSGIFKSPQLLQLSGVGDPQALQAIGITPVVANRAVGHNLRDHFLFTVSQRVRGITTLNERARGVTLVKEVLKYTLLGSGMLTQGTGTASGFYRSRPDLPAPDTQLMFWPGSYAQPGVLEGQPGMSIGFWPSHPRSHGTVAARSADPLEPPRIHLNFLSDEEDQRVIVEGVRKCRAIFGSRVMAPWIGGETTPGQQVRTDDEVVDYARQHGRAGMHMVGTCRMGSDERAVVDPQLRVRGAAGLRVVDASVMPNCTVGNINATVVALAERAADLILGAA